MWLSVSDKKKKVAGLYKSDRQPITVCHIG